jgi:hypothetical protein
MVSTVSRGGEPKISLKKKDKLAEKLPKKSKFELSYCKMSLLGHKQALGRG